VALQSSVSGERRARPLGPVPRRTPKPEASALCGAWRKPVVNRVRQDRPDSYWGSVAAGLASALFSKSAATSSCIPATETVGQGHDNDVLRARICGRSLSVGLFVGLTLFATLISPARAAEYSFAERWRWAHFTTEDGLPSDRITEILEARDGTTWVSTSSGVAWFDGYRWHRVGPREGLPSGSPGDITADESSGILVVIEGKLYRGDRKGFLRVPVALGEEELDIHDAASLPGGRLMILVHDHQTDTLSLYQVAGGAEAKNITEIQSPGGREADLLSLASPNALWVVTSKGLFRWEGGSWRGISEVAVGLEGLVCGKLEDETEGLCIATPRGDRGLRTWVASTQPLPPFTVPQARLVGLDVSPDGTVLALDDSGTAFISGSGTWIEIDPVPRQLTEVAWLQFRANGDLWAGTGHGLYLYHASTLLWEYWKKPARESKNRVHEIFEADDGSVWIASDEGVEVRPPDGHVRRFERVNGCVIRSTGVAQDGNGDIWVTSGSAYEGAFRFDGTAWSHFGPEQGLHGYRHKVRIDRKGRPWFLGLDAPHHGGLAAGTGAAVYEDGRFTHWTTADGLLHDRVFAFAEGREGEFWFGTLGGLSRWQAGRWTHWTTANGLRAARVWTIDTDENNRLWFSHEWHGLGTIEGDTPRYLTTEDGLLANEVQDIRADPRGGIWVSCRGGVARYHGGRWCVIPTDSGIGHPSLWPVVPTRDRVYIGTLGAGTVVLNRTALESVSFDVLLTGPSIREGLATVRWHAAARDALIRSHEIETHYRLDNGSWSEWLSGRSATVPAVPGSHTFTVEARSRLAETPTAEGHLSFAVPYPVYRHPLAVSVALALTAVIASLFVLMSIRRRQHYAALREREERFRAVAQNVPGAVFAYDINPDGHRTPIYVGPGFEKLIGRGPAGRLAAGLNDVFFELLHPDDLDALRRAGVFEPDYAEPVDLEYRFRTDGESYRWVRSIAHPSRLENGSLRWHGVLVDIDDRKAAEEALRRESLFRETVIQSCAEGLCVCHDLPEHPYVAFTVWNRRMNEITGYTMEQINDLGWYQTVYSDPKLQEQAIDRMNRMREGDDLIAEEWEITRADGEKRMVEISTTVIDAEPGTTHVLALMQDVTERKQAEETRAQLESQLRHAHKLQAVEQLAAGISHDFNSVLAVVQGNAELLRTECRRRELPDPKRRIAESLEQILDSAQRGQKLIQHLLTFGRERSWTEKPINLNECIDFACRMFKGLLDGNVQIRVLKEQSLRSVHADAGKVERALVNLLLNARDAMPDGGKLTIETANVVLNDAYVATHAEATPGPHVVVSVGDTGTGMDEPTRERLFEPFFTTKPVGQGSGLGLSIVHGVVNRAGGHITVVSDVGKGTTFRLYLPAIAQSDE